MKLAQEKYSVLSHSFFFSASPSCELYVHGRCTQTHVLWICICVSVGAVRCVARCDDANMWPSIFPLHLQHYYTYTLCVCHVAKSIIISIIVQTDALTIAVGRRKIFPLALCFMEEYRMNCRLVVTKKKHFTPTNLFIFFSVLFNKLKSYDCLQIM